MNNDKIKNGDEMSGNEPKVARRRRKTQVAVWVGVAGPVRDRSFAGAIGRPHAGRTRRSDE